MNKRTIAGGATSLHRAAYMGHTSIVEALYHPILESFMKQSFGFRINHGADGCVQDSDGETPAHKAFSQVKYWQILKYSTHVLRITLSWVISF